MHRSFEQAGRAGISFSVVIAIMIVLSELNIFSQYMFFSPGNTLYIIMELSYYLGGRQVPYHTLFLAAAACSLLYE